MSIPLVALILLVLVIALGSLWASHHNGGGKPHSIGTYGSSHGLLLTAEVVDTR